LHSIKMSALFNYIFNSCKINTIISYEIIIVCHFDHNLIVTIFSGNVSIHFCFNVSFQLSSIFP